MNASIRQLPRQIDSALRSPWQVRTLAVLDALIVNVVILTVARLATGEFPTATVGGDEQTIGFAQVIIVTALAGLAAAGLLALLERITSRGKANWTAIAVVVFALSLLGPLGSGEGASSKVVLTLLHVGAAATIIPLMRRQAAGQE